MEQEVKGTVAALRINKAAKKVSTENSFQLFEGGNRVYSSANKPSAATLGVVPTNAFVGEGYTHLGSTHDKVGEEYKYRYYLIAEQTASNRIDCDIEVTIHGDTNYAGASGVHRIKFTRYEGASDAVGTLHISRQCTSGNPESIVLRVKKEAGKTRVWIRSNHMWGDIYAKKIGSPKGGQPTKLFEDKSFVYNDSEDLKDAVDIKANCFFDGDSGTAKQFDLHGAIYDGGQRVYSPNNKPTAAAIGAFQVKNGNETLWSSAPEMATRVNVGGLAVTNTSGKESYVSLADNNSKVNLFIDGEIYASEGRGKVYHTANKPTAADVGALAVAGKAADASKLNGKSNSSAATAGTIAERDSSGDINARLLRSNYADQTTISGAIAYRINNGSDNYTRYCSDKGAIRTHLDVYSKGEAVAKNADIIISKSSPRLWVRGSANAVDSGKIYVTEGDSHGGWFGYDGSSNVVQYGYRANGGDAIVFSHPYNSNTVTFNGSVNINGSSSRINNQLTLKNSTSTHGGAVFKVDNGGEFGTNLTISSGGNTLIAGGDGAAGNAFTANDTTENLHLASDVNVYIHAGTNTWANRKTTIFNTDGSVSFSGNLKMGGSRAVTGGNDRDILRDHGNNNVTLSATGGELFLGYSNTTKVKLVKDLVNSAGVKIIDQESGKAEIAKVVGINSDTNWKPTSGDLKVNSTGSGANSPEGTNFTDYITWGHRGGSKWYHALYVPHGGTRAGKLCFASTNSTTDTATPQMIYTSTNKPTASELGVVNKAGDTMTGNLTVPSLVVNTSGGVGTRFGSTTHKALVGVSSTAGEFLFGGSATDSTTFSTYLRIGAGTKLEFNSHKVYHSGAKPTAADVGALPLTGGSVTGLITNNRSTNHFKGYRGASADMNARLTNDEMCWSYTGTSDATVCTNKFPTTNNANGVLSFNTHTGAYGHQIGLSSNGAMYQRHNAGGTWSTWGKIYDSRNKPTASELGVEPTLAADRKRKITYGTAAPTGGADGDIYIQYK
ncbi:hypothetical protein [Vibrio vulnificus]|uniref:hypothetical protein n=1 Tax=Vibrio vulnificus TaxID=672 RepID=UPI0032424006